ncbi:suppressor of fused domain protein [Peptostreptococcus equinus]|uniref:Suppressor of fused domain protein n=1 Tax=Peptostreptococcus equinus TaxID=3003601 RepID=A0ABY7JUY7_9FIRM|nr:suppressor of fused domain protein [Peptostreptococcus sp. CBA3647]WAW15532.1 suppressor of fused domain protein [Peptostreptococcus sp. CBA3647]
MGIFDIFKKNKDNKNGIEKESKSASNKEFEKTLRLDLSDEVNDLEAPGWDAITQEFDRIYPGQDNPKHFGTFVKWMFGGNNPLDGISIYDGGDFWHFVSYGMTELYEKESQNLENSGYGYELTFKLKKDDYVDEEYEIRNICGIMQNIARQVFLNDEVYKPYEFIEYSKNQGVDAKHQSKITGFICVPDSSIRTLDTDYGKVEFLELVGVTDDELTSLNDYCNVKDLYIRLGSDITDYNRKSLL